MAIAALIDEGIGPAASIAFVITEGYSSAAAAPVARTLVTEGFGGAISSLIHEGFSAYVNLPEPPITGKQYTDVSALSDQGYDIWSLTDAASVIGDVGVTDQITARTSYAVVPNKDGSGYVNAGGDLTRQQFNTQVFHVAGLTMGAVSTVYINDSPPILANAIPPINIVLGQQISLDFIAGGYVIDLDGDPLTVTLLSGSNPPGTTLVGSLLSGFTIATYNASPVYRFTDILGETLDVPVSIFVSMSVIVPDETGVPYATASANLMILGLIVRNTGAGYSNTVAFGTVLSQSIAPGTSVQQGTSIFLQTSLGPQSGLPGFRVRAVYPGTYAGVYQQEGDVFDLASANDYSDSTVNYQLGAGDTVYGWMLQVPSNTPLLQASAAQPEPLFPVDYTGVRTVM